MVVLQNEPCTVRASRRHGTSRVTVRRPPRILLVEDDPWVRIFVRELLSDEGYDVTEAADGRSGLQLAAEDTPDLVLLDLAMPELTGMDVLHALKRMPRTRAIPVIVLSAYSAVLAPSDVSSVVGVLAKPVDVPVLLGVVRTAAVAGNVRQLSQR